MKSPEQSRRVAKNTLWLLVERAGKMAVSLLVGIAVARYLGPEHFGVLSYALSVVAFFQPLATAGLNHFVTRELLSSPAAEPQILGTTFIIRAIAGAVAALGAFFVTAALRGSQLHIALYVLAIGMFGVLRAMQVVDYWFQSRIQSRYVVWTRLAVWSIVSAGKVVMIVFHAPLVWFVGITAIEYGLTEAFLGLAYRLRGQRFSSWQVDWNRAGQYLRRTLPLIASSFAAVVYLKIDQVMIGQILTDEAVGVYAAAARVSEAWYMVPAVIVQSWYPGLIALQRDDTQAYLSHLQNYFDTLAAIGVVAGIVAFVWGPRAMVLAFGEQYAAAGSVLRIHIWAGVFVSMRALFSKWILIEDRLGLSLYTQTFGAVANVVLNAVLLPVLGVNGAAVATLVSYAAASYIALLVPKQTRPIAWMMTKAILIPIRIPAKLLRVLGTQRD